MSDVQGRGFTTGALQAGYAADAINAKSQYPSVQPNRLSPTQNTADERTAAEATLCTVEQANALAQELFGRINNACARLGCGSAPPNDKISPRPVRAGVIGSIHDRINDVQTVLNACHELMSNIERQV